MTSFQTAVLKVVRLIPPGRVASYGQLAAYLGAPQAARQVGWALRSLEGEPDFPWWRVLNTTGRITIKGNLLTNAHLQKQLLESEGVIVQPDFTLDMGRYRFQPDAQWFQALNKERAQNELMKDSAAPSPHPRPYP